MRELVPSIAAALTPLILLVILLVGPTLGLVKWQPSLLWHTEFGAVGHGITSKVTAISVDKTGLYTAGYLGTYSNVTGPSSYSFLNKFDFSGTQVWSQKPKDPVYGISPGVGGVYVAGPKNGSSAFVQKYDLDGSKIWAGQIIDLFVVPDSPISVGSAGVYVSGLGPLNPNQGSPNPLNLNQTYPVILAGYDFSGNALWTQAVANVSFGGFGMVYAGSGGVYVSGSNDTGLGLFDTHAFVSKYDTGGALQWRRQFDEPGFACWCGPKGISGDSSGIYILGRTHNAFPGQSYGGFEDTFLRKYDLNGSVLWTTQFVAPNSLTASPAQISVNQSGVYLLIFVASESVYPPDFVMKYDSSGNRMWSVRTEAFTATALSVGENDVYVGGGLVSGPSLKAYAAAYSLSSSLIIFGVDPPVSFVIAGLLVGAGVVSVLWIRKGWKKKARPIARNFATIP